MVLISCGRPGCNKQYEESENHETACSYHSGAPIFHEGQKGWTCCPKRVLTFDEFIAIEGCTKGRHSPHKEVAKPVQTSGGGANEVKLVSTESDSVEVYKASTTLPKPAPPPQPVAPAQQEPQSEEPDPPDAVIAKGTMCKHQGCSKAFVDDSSRTEKCVYHPGAPVFHETMKMWSCCNQKAFEFDKFLSFPGCKEGVHKFVDTKQDANVVNCRYDFYQSAEKVTLSIYAKKADKTKSTVQFEDWKAKVDIVFEDGKRFKKDFFLSQAIIPSQSKYEILSTKVELVLKKFENATWAKLEQ